LVKPFNVPRLALVRFSDETGVLLAQKRREGYSLTGFIRMAVDQALQETERQVHTRLGRVGMRYQKASKRRP
jgi:hypothetical protein